MTRRNYVILSVLALLTYGVTWYSAPGSHDPRSPAPVVLREEWPSISKASNVEVHWIPAGAIAGDNENSVLDPEKRFRVTVSYHIDKNSAPRTAVARLRVIKRKPDGKITIMQMASAKPVLREDGHFEAQFEVNRLVYPGTFEMVIAHGLGGDAILVDSRQIRCSR